MLRFGNISEIDPAKCYARVTFLDDGIVSDWLQIVVMGAISNEFFHIFDINEQVACMMDENSEEGVILGAVFNDRKSPSLGGTDIVSVKFSDNSSIEYNRSTHEYNINVSGNINISSSGETMISSSSVVMVQAEMVDISASNISISGNTILAGNLNVSGVITAPTVSAANITGPGVSMSGGNLEADGELKGATVVAGTIDLATHTHSGVTTGGGTSGPPTP